MEVQPIDRPQETAFCVALDRIRSCPEDIPPDTFRPPRKNAGINSPVAKVRNLPTVKKKNSPAEKHLEKAPDVASSPPRGTGGIWQGLLRNQVK